MKTSRVSQLFIILFFNLLFFNQIYSKSISLNFDQSYTFLNNKDTTVTHLKVSGAINKKIINTINNLYPNIEELNMHDAHIEAYIDENKVSYLANVIPNGAFNKKIKLKTVMLPKGVVKIGKGAFWSCTNLENIIFFDSVKVIDQFAFQLCRKLKQITFPKSLMSIGGACFASCTSLVTIKCTSKIPPLMPEWSPFPDIKPYTCVLYVPAKSIADYQNVQFLKNFLIRAQK